MKENRIKLTAVIVLSIVFMLAFTCCVNKDLNAGDESIDKITLFTPPETTPGETSVQTEDPYVTTDPIITMPPQSSGEVTTTSKPPVTSAPVETTESEDTVYNDFSGLY